MSNVKWISDALAASDQPGEDELTSAGLAPFKSVVNLRSPSEQGFVRDEQARVEAAGLRYLNLPVSPVEATEEILDRVVEQTNDLPQPVLFHCAAGARAGGLALAAWAEREKADRHRLEERAREAGVKPEQPHLKLLLERLARGK
ncbi:beta-lactamase hydrolase domain-containing protein [Sorangium sp. So ce131]|uniref:beta-lactamase hydrolase domain-containing protein n=1 Tax=Sorangium sp. So ce131 TaxID=3133282 RepID=UPI003F6487B4